MKHGYATTSLFPSLLCGSDRVNCAVALLVHHVTSTNQTTPVTIPPGNTTASAASRHMGSMQ